MKNLKIFCLMSLGLCMFGCTSEAPDQDMETVEPTASKPNIVFILVDDFGVTSTPTYSKSLYKNGIASAADSTGFVQYINRRHDTTYYQYNTPNISKFASESLVFTKMYATPLCATSRGELMTGRYPYETGITYPGWSGLRYASAEHPNADSHTYGPLNPAFTTYPKVLRDSSYYTGFGGKWNLKWGITDSDAYPGYNYFGPNSSLYYSYAQLVSKQAGHLDSCGFSNTFGTDSISPMALIGNTIDYYPTPIEGDTANNSHMNYLPYQINQWAKNFLDTAKVKSEKDATPFYLHYCLGLVHIAGVAPPPGYPQTNQYGNYAHKTHVADSLVGVIVDKIQNDSVLSENTIIVIAGDNGTENQYYSKFLGDVVEGGKFSLKTHGSNVPFMINWPGVLSPGTYTELADFADVHSTMTDIAGLDSPVKTSGYSFYDNMKEPAGSRTSVRDYVYCQAFNSSDAPESTPKTINLYGKQALIANQEYSLIPTSSGGVLYQINPITLEDEFICADSAGCADTSSTAYAAYCELNQYLKKLNPTYIPYKVPDSCP